MLSQQWHRLAGVAIWAVAFGYVEAAVVEYLRAIYCPPASGGFGFPLLTLGQIASMGPDHIRRLVVELGREMATLVMLASLAAAVCKNHRQGWAYFLIAFGVWDISYYCWLRLFLDWPQSLFTWDLLFLLPVPWVSPVLAPVMISVVMIACGLTVLAFEATGRPLQPRWSDWIAISAGGVVVIVSFCWDHANITKGGLPAAFNWPLFFAGLLPALSVFLWVVARRFR